jgi:hypothetical protein
LDFQFCFNTHRAFPLEKNYVPVHKYQISSSTEPPAAAERSQPKIYRQSVPSNLYVHAVHMLF